MSVVWSVVLYIIRACIGYVGVTKMNNSVQAAILRESVYIKKFISEVLNYVSKITRFSEVRFHFQ